MAAPVLFFRYPPALDFPQHESLVALMRRHAAPALFPPGMYALNLGHPNQLFHVASWALSFALGVPLACRVVLALSVAAIALGTGRLARRHGASTWVAFVTTPVALGWLLYWGFVTNILGLGLLLLALPAVDDLADAPEDGRTRRALVACGWVVALYFAHQLMLFVFLAALGIAVLHRGRDARGWPARLAPIALGAAITVAQQRWQAHLFVPGSDPDRIVFTRVDDRAVQLAMHTFGGIGEGQPWWPMLVVVAVLASLLFARHRAWSPSGATKRLLALAIASFALYELAPADIKGASFVFHRFLAPAYVAFFVWATARAAPAVVRALRVPFVAIGAIGVALAVPSFAAASRAAEDLDALLPRIERKSAVAGIDLDHDLPRFRPFTMIHWDARALLDRGGRVGLSFVTSPVAPVRIAERFQWNESARRLERERSLVPSVDFGRFRYVLVHSMRLALLDDAARAVAPYAREVAREGEWVLFESRGPVCALDAPEEPLPAPPPETLVERMQRSSSPVSAAP